jgi:maltooligosyltrehalose trehalohydrolase
MRFRRPRRKAFPVALALFRRRNRTVYTDFGSSMNASSPSLGRRDTPQNAPLGATPLPGNACQFLVWAPHAQRVEIHIAQPHSQIAALREIGGGYFHAVLDSVPCGSLYKFSLDTASHRTALRADPASRHQPEGVHGPSEVIDDAFRWQDAGWRGPTLENYVLYELHVGAFTPEGTFEAIIPRLAALKDLGVTAIEIMPVAQFPGTRNWGYDGVFPYAAQSTYGGPHGFKELVSAAHHHGIAVVLDVVYNHLGPEGNYLGDFGPYFTDTYHTPWGPALNFDGPGSDEVRRYFIENALRWVTSFHIDALRLDAVHAIVDPSARPFLQELGEAIHVRSRELARNIYVMPESDRNDARIVTPLEAGGLGLDSVWSDDAHHSLHVLLTGERSGYYEDFDGVGGLAVCFRDGFLYQGQYSKFRQRRHGNSSRALEGKRFIVCAQNHDQVGNRRRGDRLAQLVSFDQLKLAAGTLLLSPFIPLLFMGEEYGESAPFQYFVSHGDPALVEAVRRGRTEEFSRFSWGEDVPDPQSEQTFLRSKLNWDLREEGQHRVLWHFYRELLRLRRELPAFARPDKNCLEAAALEDQKVLVVTRWASASRAAFVASFNSAAIEVGVSLAAGRWQKLLDSSDACWHGSGVAAPDSLNSTGTVRLSLPPWTFLVFAES